MSLQDVTKTYQMGEITIKAADGISFDVEKGEFVIVVGKVVLNVPYLGYILR